MAKKGITERQRLAAVFASFSIVIMGTVSLFQSMSLDYYTVLGTLGKIIPASIILGGLGWVMGMVLDKPKRRYASKGYNSIFMNDVMKPSASGTAANQAPNENAEEEAKSEAE